MLAATNEPAPRPIGIESGVHIQRAAIVDEAVSGGDITAMADRDVEDGPCPEAVAGDDLTTSCRHDARPDVGDSLPGGYCSAAFTCGFDRSLKLNAMAQYTDGERFHS
jgi:hypothetical protein